MELLVETEMESRKQPEKISDYERERGKPMPTLLQGAIQANLGFELKLNYRNKYRIASEVTLNTQPMGSTPDLIVYPQQALEFKNDPSRREDAPLLAIEIQPASQSTNDMVGKLEPYFDFGVKSCWIVTPTLQVILVYDSPTHYEFYQKDEILKDKTLNIEIELNKVFE
jgi:Uma2 family endonuclease